MRRALLCLLLAACDSTGVDPVVVVDLGPRDADAPADQGAGPEAGLDVGVTRDEGVPDLAVDAGRDGPPPAPEFSGRQGGELADGWISLRLYAPNAERVEAHLYPAPFGEPEETFALETAGDGFWAIQRPTALAAPVYYGYRLWGPNWPFDPAWDAPGEAPGFVADVDADGHRYNPNKLVVDPFARELSHDPFGPERTSGRVYQSGSHRALDSGPVAPKGILLDEPFRQAVPGPTRAFKDDVIYEVHLRGLTRGDPDIPPDLQGTYAGAALKAGVLAELGVTAVELLPLHETQNEQNDLEESTAGDNYWGYSSLSFFAPDRRYAADKSPGGPTRELIEMVAAFHAEGIKVYVDVVYNHTGEGGAWNGGDSANLWSWRGVDNSAYYQTVDGAGYQSNNGVGPNLRFTHPQVRRMVIESLRYWHTVIGVDGFRFDLASVMANRCDEACFEFAPADSLLEEIAAALPVRDPAGGPGVDLIAEPWGIGPGTYQVGNFPAGWAEWNDQYRDAVRIAENRVDVEEMTSATLAGLIHGSSDLFRDDGRKPWHSVNFVVAHDGLTLFDLYACNGKVNDQPWPYGPSDGGTDRDLAWDHRGVPERQRQAARTGLTLLMLSSGVPMMTGGDEVLRSVRCNNNRYNLDSPANWLSWTWDPEAARFRRFTRRLLALRRALSALRPAEWTEGTDPDGNGLLDIEWRDEDGVTDFRNDSRVLAWRVDGEAAGDAHRAIFVAWNRGLEATQVALPAPGPDATWVRVLDTAQWMEPLDNIHPPGGYFDVPDRRYEVASRSVVVLVEQ